ncbi:MAG: rhamnogalacturonan acetylesterase [Armatimonadaceae bacterium]
MHFLYNPETPSSLRTSRLRRETQLMAIVPRPIRNTPTIFLCGDSTMKNGTRGQQGWGDPFMQRVSGPKIAVDNRARGGRSSRTFVTEGLWENVIKSIRTGDIVLLQFGHNDGGGLNDPRRRASLKGSGDDSAGSTDAMGRAETVLTYGAYLRRMSREAVDRGANVLLLTPVPRNRWAGSKVLRSSSDYALWTREAGKLARVPVLDLNALLADAYDAIGAQRVAELFHGDWTHTSPDGAAFTASILHRALTTCKELRWTSLLETVQGATETVNNIPDLKPGTTYLSLP